MTTTSFAMPAALFLLPLVPFAIWMAARRRRRAGAVRFSSILRTRAAPASLRQRAMALLPALRAMALVCLIVALARPQSGIGEIRTTADGVAIMLVVDRSLSMSYPISDEAETSRMDVVKRVCRSFIRGEEGLGGRPEDLIGLVTFARYGDTTCPLVRIHDTLVKLIENIELADQASDAGTAIGEGLSLAAARLKKAEDELRERNEGDLDPEFEIKSKVIVLMTDGDENAGEIRAMEAAQLAAQWGIKVYAIGIGGSATGYQTLQTPLGVQRLPIGSSFNESLLRRIAEQTGGRYWTADDENALEEVYAEIDKLETTRIESKEYTSYDEAFMPWAIAAAVAIALEMTLAGTWLRRAP